MNALTFQITGEVNVEITITELADGTLKIDIQVLDDTGSIGDLRGLFFDLADDTLTSGLSISGDDVADEKLKVDGVSSTGGSNNIKGEILNEYGKFDVGIEFGTQGIATDDIRSTSFILSHSTETLSLADLELQDIAVRLMSVGEEGGSRDGSLKLGGEVPEASVEINAYNDSLTVLESEGAGDIDLTDDGTLSVLDNDTTDNAPYTGSVLAVNGDAANLDQAITGSNGGLLTLHSDGTFDFDANGEFDAMLDGESAVTTFTYEIEDGKTATITVTVLGEGLIRVANNDVMTVSESETFGDADVLDSGDVSVLANDTENGGAYTGVVGTVNGDLGNVNSFVAGDNGGLLKVNADGTVDFDANGEFEALASGDTTQTTFTYTLISGEEATITVNVTGETDYAAADDVITVMESETSGDLETLDSGATTILANDTQDSGAYGGNVEAVSGVAANVGQVVTGSNGGQATIFADGTIDFDAMDQFDYLADGETAQTMFTYDIAGGETANVTVNVQGEDDVANGQVINLALMMSSTATMFAQAATIANGVPGYADWNGDGVTNQVIDLAYLMLEDFISDAFDDAAAAGATLNISLIDFGQGATQFYTVSNATGFHDLLDVKVAADDSGEYGTAFANADAWFDTVSSPTDTNAVFLIGDGFSSDPFGTAASDLVTEHNVQIDAYIPDVVYNGTSFDAMSAVDKDGYVDAIFVEDTATADMFGGAGQGVVAATDALSLDHLLA